jgi:hypothetical protein
MRLFVFILYEYRDPQKIIKSGMFHYEEVYV